MKFYVRFFIVSLSWFILMNFMSFGASVYAAVAPIGPISVPFSDLPEIEQDAFLSLISRLLYDISEKIGDSLSDVIDSIPSEAELALECGNLTREYVEGVQDSDGTTLYYIFNNSDDTSGGLYPASVIVDEACSLTHESYASNLHKQTAGGRISINSNSYSNALSNILGTLGKGSFSIGMEIVNGMPSNVVNINEDSYISVFDELGLEYTVAPSLLDFQINVHSNKTSVPSLMYTPYLITSENKLYLFRTDIKTLNSNSSNILNVSFFNVNNLLTNGSTLYPLEDAGRFTLRFVDNSNHLYFCFSSSYYKPSLNTLFYSQYTFGNPQVNNAPLLFHDYRDGLGAPVSAELNTYFENHDLSGGVCFYNSVDTSDFLTDSVILSTDIIAAGYFQGVRFNDSTLNSAGQILLSSENVVSGGYKTVTSELTDWQKAIFVLAQQQGISFEEMLKKLDLIIDSNGKITLLGLDGIEYSVSELSKQFDKLIGSVGDISGDLSELLEYLKSLNIEGLEGYISSIEGTLNDLNERDKDNSAVLGDCLGTLNDLKEHLDELDCAGISANLELIAKSISHAMELEDVQDIQGMDSSFIIDKFPFSLPFDLYHIVTLFVREPVKPIFTIPIQTEINAFGLNEEINEEIVLDLTMFQINGVDIVQAVLRFSIIVGYVIMLLKLTTRFFV